MKFTTLTTALFLALLPASTIAGRCFSGGKQGGDSCTVEIGANACGDHRIVR